MSDTEPAKRPAEKPSIVVRAADHAATVLDGRYRIEREVGRGGMSVVYLATDLRYPRPVAVKLIDRAGSEREGIDRFMREVEIVSSLQHPHILPLYDSGDSGGKLYFVMPYVPDGSLAERLVRERQLPVDEAVRFACEIAGALKFAHERGVVHRDIKPGNVLLWAAHATLADFGIGKALAVAGAPLRPELTRAGGIIGTPAYISPEQAAGESELDGRSDLYSLGCVLFQMLTGETPFGGSTAMAMIARRFTEDAPPLASLRPGVTCELSDAVHHALARDPADRFQTAGEFIDALTSFTTESSSAVTRTTRAVDGSAGVTGSAPGGESQAPGKARAAPSVAVIPFANLSTDPENEYLADGLTDEIISGLSRLRTIRVAARTSAFAVKGRPEDARTIGMRFKVESLLEGSVRSSGGRVRVIAQLVSTADGYQIWSERYDRTLDDVLVIQEDIARSIIGALEESLVGGQTDTVGWHGTESIAAYDAFLRGRHWTSRRTRANVERGIAEYESAIKHDSRFARAYAGLADAYAVLAIHGHGVPTEVMPRAWEAAARALALDPTLADAYASMGRISSVYGRDAEAAERTFHRAIALNPRYPTAHHWYALDYLMPQGRFAEALAAIEHARSLEPLSPLINASLGLPWYFSRDYEAAIVAYQHALAIDPEFGLTHLFMGQALAQSGRPLAAIQTFERATELIGPTAELRGAIGHAYAMAGNRKDAYAVVDELRLRSAAEYVSPCLSAQILTALGEPTRALECLAQAHAERAMDLIWLAVRPTFDLLRAESGFVALLKQIHAPAKNDAQRI